MGIGNTALPQLDAANSNSPIPRLGLALAIGLPIRLEHGWRTIWTLEEVGKPLELVR